MPAEVWVQTDAVLARRPQLALVDELAHTNAPGSRHPKRYQDVMELLGGHKCKDQKGIQAMLKKAYEIERSRKAAKMAG